MSRILIKTDGIHSVHAKIVIIDDDGTETPIPGLYKASVKLKLNSMNKAKLTLYSYVDIDAVAELTGIDIEQSSVVDEKCHINPDEPWPHK